MAFFKFKGDEINILPGIDNEPVYYSFMERGDLVYYRPPGSDKSIMATIESFTRDGRGQIDFVTIRTGAGEFIETSIKTIKY